MSFMNLLTLFVQRRLTGRLAFVLTLLACLLFLKYGTDFLAACNEAQRLRQQDQVFAALAKADQAVQQVSYTQQCHVQELARAERARCAVETAHRKSIDEYTHAMARQRDEHRQTVAQMLARFDDACQAQRQQSAELLAATVRRHAAELEALRAELAALRTARRNDPPVVTPVVTFSPPTGELSVSLPSLLYTHPSCRSGAERLSQLLDLLAGRRARSAPEYYAALREALELIDQLEASRPRGTREGIQACFWLHEVRSQLVRLQSAI